MDPINTIVAAIVAGSVVATKDVATQAVVVNFEESAQFRLTF